MKHVDVNKPSIYTDFNKKKKKRNHVRISKYKNFFAKGYVPNWSEEVFMVKKVKNTVL